MEDNSQEATTATPSTGQDGQNPPHENAPAIKTALTVVESKPGDLVLLNLDTIQGFEGLQRAARLLAASTLIPQDYRGSIPNCAIALNMAGRIGADPLMVMQNLYLVHGHPSWSSQFYIAAVNACGRFTSIRYDWTGEPGTDTWGCRAWAIEKSTNERLEGTWITVRMAKEEEWWFKPSKKDPKKNASKWPTMTEQMLRYRAASFWTKVYAPELTMGLQTQEELEDMGAQEFTPSAFEVTAPKFDGAQNRLGGDPDGTTSANPFAAASQGDQSAPQDTALFT